MGAYHLPILIAFLLAFWTVSHSRHIVQPSQNTIQSQLSDSGICLTPACIKAADEILTNMDETVNPCDNFYQFACGGYVKNTELPEEVSQTNVFYDAQADLNQHLLELLQKKYERSDPDYVKLLNDMYHSCMDLELIESEGSRDLEVNLNSMGGWPVIQGRQWDESRFDWVDSLIKMKELGYNFDMIFEVGVSPDFRNNKVNILALDQAKLGMPDRSYLVTGLSDPHTAEYYKMMVVAAKLMGADESTARSEMLSALRFEMTLANISMAEEERRDMNKLYNKYTIGELQNLAPQIPWLKYFNGLLNDEVDENEQVIVGNPNYINKFADMLPTTDKRVIANYMMWRVVLASMGSLSKEWRDIPKKYEELMSGASGESEREQECLESLTSSLGVALSSYYVKNYFNEESKQEALVIVEAIKNEFIKILSRIDWMDEDTKREAIEKAKTIKTHIGYPAELADEEAVNNYYEKLTLTSSFYQNTLKLNRWMTNKSLSELRKPVIKGMWTTYANVLEVNAYYNPMENCIVFPASILQNAMFNKDRPYYMNFGGIGYVVGHEITHGFDDQGRQFDKDGNNLNWWGHDTDELFTEKAQCIINQYGNYTAENGMKLNGVNTLGENIADNGGLKEAYWAYLSWVEENSPEQALPGVNYTPNQLFWISAANTWCSKYRPEVLANMIVTDNHSPSEYRIIGPMSNLEEFSREFNCPLGSPMNKPHKCQVW